MLIIKNRLNEFIWRTTLRRRSQYQVKAYFKRYGMTIGEAMEYFGRNVLLTEEGE